MYKVLASRQALKDSELLKNVGLSDKAKEFARIVAKNPFQTPPPYEKMTGDLQGYYSRRINRKHRFVYEVLPNTDEFIDEEGTLYSGIVKIIRMWTHYE